MSVNNNIEITERMVNNADQAFANASYATVPLAIIRAALEAALNPKESLCSECNHPHSSHTPDGMCPPYKATYWTPGA